MRRGINWHTNCAENFLVVNYLFIVGVANQINYKICHSLWLIFLNSRLYSLLYFNFTEVLLCLPHVSLIMYCIVIIAIVVLVIVIPLIIEFLYYCCVNLFIIIIIVYEKIDLITASWGPQRALKMWGPGAFAPTAPPSQWLW